MYPLNADKPWPDNQWYVAGFASELRGELVGRKFLNKPVVMFRDSSGTPRALSGICPHRMMPMELGALVDDRLVCGYHGLTFDLGGACVEAPTSGVVPNCALARYPIIEAGPLLWIWMGDQAQAEATPLPDQQSIGLGAEGWRTDCNAYFPLHCRYTLLIDNLFDLSHLGFIHASIVGSGGIAIEQPKIADRDGRLVVSRDYMDQPVDGYHRFLHPGLGDRMSTRLDSELLGISLINAGGPVWDGSTANDPVVGHMNFVHAVTPETEGRTHYWIMTTRDFRNQDDGLSIALSEQNRAVAAQDVVALEAIERALCELPVIPREISMKSDQGALMARRRVIEMIAGER